MKVLGRGYAMVQDKEGAVLRSVEQVFTGDRIRVQLADGCLGCTVDERE